MTKPKKPKAPNYTSEELVEEVVLMTSENLMYGDGEVYALEPYIRDSDITPGTLALKISADSSYYDESGSAYFTLVGTKVRSDAEVLMAKGHNASLRIQYEAELAEYQAKLAAYNQSPTQITKRNKAEKQVAIETAKRRLDSVQLKFLKGKATAEDLANATLEWGKLQ